MNEKTKPQNDATLPLWRVTYNYIRNYQLRTGTYVIPANSAQEAKERAGEILTNTYADTGPYKVLNAKPF